jgi:hypothetical protein
MESIAMTDALGQHISPGIQLDQASACVRSVSMTLRQVAAMGPEHRCPGYYASFIA